MSAKFRTSHCANVTDLASVSNTNYIITHCYVLCPDHTVLERPENLQEASKCGLFPLCHFVQTILPWIREFVPGEITDTNILKRSKALSTSSIPRLSYEWREASTPLKTSLDFVFRFSFFGHLHSRAILEISLTRVIY